MIWLWNEQFRKLFPFFFTVLLINTTECIWDTWRTSIGEDLKILANKQGSIPLAKLIYKWVSLNAELYSPVKKLEWLNRVESLIMSPLTLKRLWESITVTQSIESVWNWWQPCNLFSVLTDSLSRALGKLLFMLSTNISH